ncbi:TonB-dependent receptor [Deminuibacter soli]|uniref:TonB-dependent receptor n=1 Tax=Deminuibacter soli TaxID=2291815 RepID=A0A3E1NHM2_9BACT|nr:TonB-dependent receptor [Deminuibacter soli]RFM27443.1 TonB-dependent receptor [Deminuibacter soli]
MKYLFLFFLAPLAATAQDTATRRLDSVFVTTGAARRATIAETPVSISVISGRKLDRTLDANIIDVLAKQVPGVAAVKTGPNISKPFIRGLGYNRVLTLYDGIKQEGQQWGDEHGIELDPYQVQKVELVKGPASLLYGSDALAGVVSFFSFVPIEKDGKLHGRAGTEYQSNNGLLGNSIRLHSSNEHWRWTASAAQRLAKNYRNATDGRVYLTGFNERHAAAMAGYTGRNGSISINGTLYDNIQGIPDGSRDSSTRQFTKQVADGAADDITTRPAVSSKELSSYRISPLHQHIQHYRIYTNAQLHTGNSEWNALLSWQQNTRREYNHPLQTQQPGLFVQLQTIQSALRWSSTISAALELSGGINGMYQQNQNRSGTDFPIPDYHLYDAGIYGFAKWKTGRFTVSAGIRQDKRLMRSKDFYVRHDTATGYDYHTSPTDTAGASLQFPALRNSFSGTSYSLGFTYRINTLLTLKANIARGFRAPNIAEIASNGLDPGAHIVYLGNRQAQPEFSLEEDLGLLAENALLHAGLSLFHNYITSYIYLSQVSDAHGDPVIIVPGNRTYRYGQADAQLIGLEAYVSTAPFADRSITVGNSFSLIYGFNKESNFQKKGIYGEYLPLIPPFQNTAIISKTFSPGPRWLPAVTCGAEWQYTGAQNRFLALNSTETATAAYQLININAGATIAYARNKTLQCQLQVNNLLNTVYQSNLSRLKYFEYYSSSPNGRSGIYNMGLNACVKVIVEW